MSKISAPFSLQSGSKTKGGRADEEGVFPSTMGSNGKKFSGGRSLYPMTTLGGSRTGSEERIVNEEGGKGEDGSSASGTEDGKNLASSRVDGITVVTETIVHDSERKGSEGKLQKSHWPLHK